MNKQNFFAGWILVITVMTSYYITPINASENKNIAVYGASGRIGHVIVLEALERGHKVTGLSRNPDKLTIEHKNFIADKGDLMDVKSIRTIASKHDAIVISVSARAPDNKPENSLLVKFTENIHEAFVGLEKTPYILQVGGANLMFGMTYDEIKANMQKILLDVPFAFEEGTPMHAVLFGHQISLRKYRDNNLSWTILAPPINIRGIFGKLDNITTKASYRVSTTEVLVDSKGENSIYVRDLAKAALSEIEKKEFNREVFTVGY